MPNLCELQALMAGALREHGSDRAILQAQLLPRLSTAAASAADAFGVSRNNFVMTLTSALETRFPAVSKLVGKQFFDHAAAAFVRAEPPASPWLDAYGASFPAFLAGYATLAALPYVAEVAQLECLVNLALHAVEVRACDVTALASLEESVAGTLRFHPAPSFGLMRADHPVDAIWSAVLQLVPASEGDHDNVLAAIDLQSGPVHLCISRQRHGVDVRRLPGHAWHIAHALSAGIPLSVATAGFDGDIAGLLADLLAAGCFTSYSIGA